jgi:uncharacterized protein (TIGR00299 family) protein
MICYFDCSSGISGDMILGAVVDAGISLRKLQEELSSLPISGYSLNVKSVKRAGLASKKVTVRITAKRSSRKRVSEARKWKDIQKIVKKSSLSQGIKEQGLSVFKRLFIAEAKVHGKRFDTIHLHELGAVDCIVDIFGSLIGLDLLGIDEVYCSPLNLGSGVVKTEHGILPVPAPATVELLHDIPVYSSGANGELTTPTGAAIISSLTSGFGSMPAMKISKTGVGAGTRDVKNRPNVLRLFVGQEVVSGDLTTHESGQRVTVIETNIDDMNPQVYEYVTEKLFQDGALDVFLTQVIMKKGRPGVQLTVLSSNDKKDNVVETLLRETTSIGLRWNVR